MAKMQIAILGGGNCYALNLARHALALGHDVIGIGRSALKGDAFTLGAEQMGYRYHVFAVGPDTEFILELLEAEKVDVVVNFAAQGEGQASFKPSNWKHFFRTNTQSLVELTERLLNIDRLKAFVQVGTSELYGSVDAPVSEDAPVRPSSPYAASKAAFDMHLLSISRVCQFPAVIVRPSNAYCPGQQLHRIIPKAFISAFTGQKLPLHGGGFARKSYLHADDLSRAILLVAEKGRFGDVYNCGPDEPVSIKRLIEMVAQCVGVNPSDLYTIADERTGQDGCYWLDSSKLKALGWQQQIPLLGGIAMMKHWIESHPELWTMDNNYKVRA